MREGQTRWRVFLFGGEWGSLNLEGGARAQVSSIHASLEHDQRRLWHQEEDREEI